MVQHLSIRVPWHDNGWNGTICKNPKGNTSCLKLDGISEGKNENFEDSICGNCIQGYENNIPCLKEGSAFMSEKQFIIKEKHPYSTYEYGYDEYKNFLETDSIYPPFSLPARPFAWLLKSNLSDKNRLLNLEIDEEKEKTWPKGKDWLQFGESHKAIFDYFYKDIVPEKSLCIIYAKQIPYIEDVGRVIIGIGHIKKVVKPIEYRRKNPKGMKSMLWEAHICHSIRNDFKDGFLIPYEKIMKYAEEHPEFDVKSTFVMAPSDYFDEFSYATEHVSQDATIEVLLSCMKAFKIINTILDDDYSNVLQWIDKQLNDVWNERGAFPGLGSMLCAHGLKYGTIVAKEIVEKSKEGDTWELLEKMFDNPQKVLSKTLAEDIDTESRLIWKTLKKERKEFFKLLSRIDISIEQAEVIFENNKRIKHGIYIDDKDFINNPYLLYEKTRLLKDELVISANKIDRAIFPIESIQKKYPLKEPTALSSDRDIRRVRAIMIQVLESAALEGHTILPNTILLDRIQALPLMPECAVTEDYIRAIKGQIGDDIIIRYTENNNEYCKLSRIDEFDREIERKFKKKRKLGRIEIEANWEDIFDEYLNEMGIKPHPDPEKEKKIREEKIQALQELAESRISVLVGGAGTGKTTVLGALCSHVDVINGGVLLLAPTGKATVRLSESMGKNADNFEAKNIAQFLNSVGGYDTDSKRYLIPEDKIEKHYETVIIDEASMLTEEMLGSLFAVVGSAKRVILVGDSKQLPPIGAGRPFVDIIRILQPELDIEFPRVKNGYCELLMNCRQSSETPRIDVEFADLFADRRIDRDKNIITQILKEDTNDIKILRWNDSEDLFAKLGEVFEKELKITDQFSFDATLGGNRGTYNEKYSYFLKGVSKNVENWQILAPVKNMEHGVFYLNRKIHETYRSVYIELANRYGGGKRIPSAWGLENIVEGDKVINVRNITKKGYPSNNCRGYIANGEVGIACGNFKKEEWIDKRGKKQNCRKPEDNGLRVEFSSQDNCGYFYDGGNFNDEKGTNDLELAYALTTHKAQGSQFEIVIIIIAEPCRILSKELLYTALTRQKEKVIILYNDDPHKLLDYTSPKYSDIAQRFTDLFYGIPLLDNRENKPFIIRKGEKFYEKGLIHMTSNEEFVRSKSEVIIADHLKINKIRYTYEPELEVNGRIFRPDFVAYDPDDDEMLWLWEHVGLPNDPDYMADWEEKLKCYNENGIVEDKNLIITYEGINGSINAKQIDEKIKKAFDL